VTAGVDQCKMHVHGLVAHMIHDKVFLIIQNVDYAKGYKASHPQSDLN
jgi:hypothetical protein